MGSTGVAGYILAGGKSSRMGQDKAMLQFRGQTLLRRAVSTMRGVTTEVAIVGERSQLEGADRAIPDRSRGCGPLGGMEAALNDLVTHDTLREYDWACFLPVDMPLLPPELYTALIRHWLETATGRLRIAYVVTDGSPQPLVSLLHRSMLPHLTESLRKGNLKVTSVFRESAHSVAFADEQHLSFDVSETESIKVTEINTRTAPNPADLGPIIWTPTRGQLSSIDYWFSNINTPEQLHEASAL